MKRRQFLRYGCLVATTPFISVSSVAKTTTSTQLIQKKFDNWCQLLQSPSAQGLVPYFSNDSKTKLSVVSSCKLLLYYLKTNQLNLAKNIGNGLVYWHTQSLGQSAKIVRGGLPSEITANSTNQLGNYYYASDNLLTIYALLSLYEITKVDSYAKTALSIGLWLEKTLFDGVRHGLWKSNYGPAMNYVLSNGAFENSIHGAGSFLWLKALQKLHALDSRHGWNERLTKAIRFMKNAQMPSGAWYTSFKPDANKKTGQWLGYAGNDITIGDDNLRSALAAQYFGMQQEVKAFENWLKPHQDTLLWGYLSTKVSQPQFLPTDKPYFDVVCTGLLRTW